MPTHAATEQSAIAALDHIAHLIIDQCGPLRVWDEQAPYDAVLAALARRLSDATAS